MKPSEVLKQNSVAQILQESLLLVPKYGFTAKAVQEGSRRLGSPKLPERTLDALFPSAPVAGASSILMDVVVSPAASSLSREELIADARRAAGAGATLNGIPVPPDSAAARMGFVDPPQRASGETGDSSHRTGPSRALFVAWLEQGRGVARGERDMPGSLSPSAPPTTGDAAALAAIRRRLEYNEPVLDVLGDALALLSATHEAGAFLPLTAFLPTHLLPPNPVPYMEHVAALGHDFATAAKSEAQGSAWYPIRAKYALAYASGELSSLSLSGKMPPEQITQAAFRTAQDTLSLLSAVHDPIMEGTNALTWITKSWSGILNSVGLDVRQLPPFNFVNDLKARARGTNIVEPGPVKQPSAADIKK